MKRSKKILFDPALVATTSSPPRKPTQGSPYWTEQRISAVQEQLPPNLGL